jgi:hypothetical protein
MITTILELRSADARRLRLRMSLSIKQFAPTIRLLLAIALLSIGSLVLPKPAAAQSDTWTTETVDVSGKFTSLAVDGAGNLHLSYSNDEGIKYGFRPAGGSKWFTMKVDGGQTFTRIALDPKGRPSICYTPDVMKYASWDGRQWKIQQIDPGIGVASYSCTVAIAADGTPHVTWYQERNPDYSNYLHFKYAVLRDGVWMARTIDFDAQTGKWQSMTLDAHGNPHISYDAYVSGQLKYAVWDGKNWVVKSVDARTSSNQPYRGMGSSLVLDSKGLGMISYYYDGELKFARQKESGAWSIETIDSVSQLGSWVGFRSSLALDQEGMPQIAYDDGGRLKYAYFDGARWHVQVVIAASYDPYRYCSIVVDSNDTPYISYRDSTDGSLKVAIGHRDSKPQVTEVEQAPGKIAPAH